MEKPLADQSKLLWGGRFAAGPSPELTALSRSHPGYFRLSPEDLAGSRAHARELQRAGVLSAPELAQIGLTEAEARPIVMQIATELLGTEV